MANIHGAIAVCEKRIQTKWDKIARNRVELEKLCVAAEKRGRPEAQLTADKLDGLKQLLDENRNLMQEIEKQYLALFSIRCR